MYFESKSEENLKEKTILFSEIIFTFSSSFFYPEFARILTLILDPKFLIIDKIQVQT